MKVAILLSGQLRTWRLCRELLKKQILDHYDCDIFIAIDQTNNLQHDYKNSITNTPLNEIKEVIEFYKPKSYISNIEIDYHYLDYFPTKIKIYNKGNIKYNFSNNIYSCDKIVDDTQQFNIYNYNILKDKRKIAVYNQYYYLSKCIDIMHEYSNKNNIIYDCVIRLRFDQFLISEATHSILNILQLNNNTVIYSQNNIDIIINTDINLKLDITIPLNNSIYIFGAGNYEGVFYVNDQFFIISYENILKLKDIEKQIFDMYRDSAYIYWPGNCHIEHIFARLLIKYNLEITKNNFGGIFIREFN